MVQNLKKVLKSEFSYFFSFLRHEVPFKANNNREAVVVCAKHVVKRPSKRSVLVATKLRLIITKLKLLNTVEACFFGDEKDLKIDNSPLRKLQMLETVTFCFKMFQNYIFCIISS